MSLQREKVIQASGILKEENIDLWITVGRESTMNSEPILPIISSVEFGALTAIMITPEKSICLCGHLEFYAFSNAKLYDEVVCYDKSFDDEFNNIMKKINPKTIAMNYSTKDVASDGLSFGLYLKFKEMFDNLNLTNIVSSESIIGKLKGRKTQEELRRIKLAIEKTEEILLEVKDFIKIGKTDIDLFNFCHERIKFHNVDFAWEKEHNPGVYVGSNSQAGHKGPEGVVIKEGDLIVLDFGTKVLDYCSDIQRTYYVAKQGEKDVPQYLKDKLSMIHTSISEGMKLMRPGTPAYVPDLRAREVLKENNLPDFNFGFGHQVGRSTHDGGVMMGPLWERYKGMVEDNIEETMVFTVDVNLTFENGRIGQEDCVYVDKDETYYLSKKQTEIYFTKG